MFRLHVFRPSGRFYLRFAIKLSRAGRYSQPISGPGIGPGIVYIVSSYLGESLAGYRAGMNPVNRYRTGPGALALALALEPWPWSPGPGALEPWPAWSPAAHICDTYVHRPILDPPPKKEAPKNPTQKRGPEKEAPKTPHRKKRAQKFITIIFP